MRAGPERAPRVRLWVLLAVLATAGVAAMHAIHLVIGTRIATRSLAREQEALGSGIARLVASDAADPILTHDTVALSEIVVRAGSMAGIAYCFVVKDGEAVATSFRSGTPPALVALREGGGRGPIVVASGDARYLDIEEPILQGKAGAVRIGIDMSILQSTRRSLAIPLGLLSVGLIFSGAAASLLLARTLAKPIHEIVAAADRFDPSSEVEPLVPRGAREIAILVDRFDLMMRRLRAAHDDRERVREQALANARLATLGSLVAGVAHEVNNPLASLKACVTLLRSEDEQARAHDLDLMDDALDRLRDVVRRLLDLARPRPLELAPTPLADLAREAAALASLSLKQRRIAIDVSAEPGTDGRLVLADRKQISQALLNLLLNAAYFSRDGGRVRVRLRSRTPFRGISVEDDGPGIPEDIRDRLSEPFFSTKPTGEGTGLGLSVTRSIVDRHHGSLEFEFPSAGGTVATVWLPPAEAAPDSELGVAKTG